LNACYGGTAALLNSVAWIESRDWDGRLALVVAGDIAIYEKGPARPTGGAGAVAILIGPNAPLILERGTTAHYMQHAFDFYKPNPACEYPLVDGQTSISCYLRALDSCYNLHLDKIAKRTGESVDLSHFDHFVFHCPYGKLVRKSLGRLLFNDALREPSSYPDLAPYCDAIIESTYNSRELDKVLAESSADIFDKKTLPGRLIPSQVGNSYCASVYAGLISLLANLQSSSSIGLRIGIFSYGSGLAASLFSLQIIGDLDGLVPNSVEIGSILSERIRVSPKEFDDVLLRRESLYCAKDWTPSPPTELRQGTFYLSRVDKEYRRHYNRL
jgi:hydroxymethylglutaryl-CoA synthase